MAFLPIAAFAAGLVLCPLLPGIINKTKAFFAGRQGPPVLQAYRDFFKLMRKGTVISRTAGPVLAAGAAGQASALVLAWALVPFGSGALVHFQGDLILFAALLGLSRFCLILAALDTGSAFEGLGAGREAFFSALTEPVLFLVMAGLARSAGSLSWTGIHGAASAGGPSSFAWVSQGIFGVSLFLVFLTENARIPVDDANTHLELTMVHEVMTLDHGGPDLAVLQYASWLKLWILGAVTAGVFCVPLGIASAGGRLAAALAGLALVAVTVGLVESAMARYRLSRVPQWIVSAGVLAVLGMVIVLGAK